MYYGDRNGLLNLLLEILHNMADAVWNIQVQARPPERRSSATVSNPDLFGFPTNSTDYNF